MADTQPAQNSSTAATMISDSATATVARAGGPVRPLPQVLYELLEALATLLMVEVTPTNQVQHSVDVAKLREEIAQAKEDLNTEHTRMETERAALERGAQRIQAENFRLSLDQNASNVVFNRRHQSRLPTVYDARNLFKTPGVGTSNPPVVDQAVEAPVAGPPV